jgi:hypothetical protein
MPQYQYPIPQDAQVSHPAQDARHASRSWRRRFQTDPARAEIAAILQFPNLSGCE